MRARSTSAVVAIIGLGVTLLSSSAAGANPPAARAVAHPAVAPLADVARASAPPTTRGIVRAATSAGVRSAGGLGWYSSNWAGYALSAGPYTSVSGQWTVPTVSPIGRTAYSAQWVGVDGVSSAELIQAGTQADLIDGTPRYSAWWEILPAPAVAIHALTIRAGDVIHVTIARISAGRWRITLRDARSGSFTTVRDYAGPGASAEWIEEAPLIGWRIPPLAVHDAVVFDNAMVNGRMARLSMGDAGAMLRRGALVDTPSAPDADGNGFAVAEQPTQPGSPAHT